MLVSLFFQLQLCAWLHSFHYFVFGFIFLFCFIFRLWQFLVALFTLCGFVNAMDWGEGVRGLSLVWNICPKEEVWSVSFNMPPLLLQLSTPPITLSLDLFLVFYNLQHPGVHASESSSLHIVIIILQLKGTIQSFPISSRLIFFFSLFCAFSAVWWMIHAYRRRQRGDTWSLRIVLCSHQYFAVMVYDRVPCRISLETFMGIWFWLCPPDPHFFSLIVLSIFVLFVFCSWMPNAWITRSLKVKNSFNIIYNWWLETTISHCL